MLSLFGVVRPGEGATALLMLLNIFLLLTAYYIIKPVREALILGEAGAEIKSYASAAQAALLLVIVPVYGFWASRLNRVWLINGITALFITNLAAFYALGRFGVPLGIPFYLWVGLFNVLLVTQFWALANDIYTEGRGERLFGVIGVGASLGSIAGAFLARRLFEPAGPYAMMLVSAILLACSMILTVWIHHREEGAIREAIAETPSAQFERPLAAMGGFQLVFRSRYLFLIALLVVISNCVNTTGEFILGKTVAQAAQVATHGSLDQTLAVRNYIGRFYADFFFWVNVIGAGLQMFVVSRLMQFWGTGRSLLLLPFIALGGYTMLALAPVLGLIRITKIAENTVDYSIQNTGKNALFLSTSRSAKYKAKTAIDSFFWRMGDALSGLFVFAGTQWALSTKTFAAVNVGLIVVWITVVIALSRRRTEESVSEPVAA
ncbi:MAG TPA: Npt1/Npt2 family nucleotide transporter [Terriglobia bacterium]|nr:Npt1/Npt2 family nucleotide transporter [Terriglobia bacterium]